MAIRRMTVKWNGRAVASRAESERARVLGRAAEHVLTAANDRVPIDEGTLMRSGSTDVDAGAGQASVSYDTAYAIRLHENPQYNFRNGREGKWLERAFASEQGAVGRIFGELDLS